MRQKKFRAWNEKEKRWKYGELLKTGFYVYTEIKPGDTDMGGVLPRGSYEEKSEDLSDWMQSTDLFDKNGKEIYKGDIVEYQYLNTLEQEIRRAEVKLMSIGDINRNIEAYYPFCYSISGSYKEKDREITECYLTPSNDCEIIGNIYENPELVGDN